MTLRIFPSLAACASLALFSCTVYPEGPARPPQQPNGQTVNAPDQLKIKQQREELKRANELASQGNPEQTTETTTHETTTAPPAQPKQKRDFEKAAPVPGKEGFVFSPYNNKVIDVRDMPSGTLVADPTYPPAEKKYFRVP